MSDATGSWLSGHVFYHADADPLIVEFLLPLIDGLRADDLVHMAFFLRHWERGPHVRLRLKVAAGHVDAVRARVERAVCGYLAEHPGPADADPEALRKSLRWLSHLEHGSVERPEVQQPVPANSFRWIDYRPELVKYGGPVGVAVAEDVFDVSSTLAGQVLRTVPVGRARLGVALQLLLLSARALGLDVAQQAVFLRHYHERWSGYLAEPRRLLTAWDSQYRSQASTYRELVEAVTTGAAVGKGLGRAWEALLVDAIGRLRPLVEAGEVWPGEVDRGAPAFVALAALVCQYLHTTNNRLNVRPQGECFVAYLGHRAVSELLADRGHTDATEAGPEPATLTRGGTTGAR